MQVKEGIMKRFTLPVLVLIALVHSLQSPLPRVACAEELLTIGSAAPELDIEHWLSDGGGKYKRITKFEAGKVYVVEFWATWCGPCVASMPHLAQLQKNYADKGVQLISISNEELQEVEDFLKRPLEGSASEDETYAKLTSVYCLTTDPDGSVHQSYMEAAGQSGIPTAFIVGKDSAIEWIGHPGEMDTPLDQVVSGTWDREAARTAMLAQQTRDLIRNQIGLAMRKGDAEAALATIDSALKEHSDDAELVEFLTQIRIRVQVFPATRLAMEGKIDEALKLLDDLKESQPEQAAEIKEVKLSVLLHGERFDDAAAALDEIVSRETNAIKLNQIGWMMYEGAKDNPEFSEKLLAAATSSAKKAVELAPEEAAIMDTYAHLLHRSGQLDQAVNIQAQAVKIGGGQNEEHSAFLEQLQAEQAEKK